MRTLIAWIAFLAVAFAGDEFVILGATREQLASKYAAAEERNGVEPMKPATKSLFFEAGEFTLRAEMWQGRCGCFFLIRKSGKMTADENARALLRAGGKWTRMEKVKDMLRSADGGLAIELGSSFRAESGAFYRARGAEK